MKNKNIPELDKLFAEIGTYRKSSDVKELFELIKKFPHIAPYNAMLIHIQKPGSRYVASAYDWERNFNRTIKAGARPLIILRPFGPVAFIFELSDTDGKEPFPEELINPFKAEGKISDATYNRLLNNLGCDGISYTEVDYGTSMAGCIQTTTEEKEEKVIRGEKEIYVKILYEMLVNKNHSKETKFTTMLHELGHLYCGHLGTQNPKWWSDRRYLSKSEVEFEAESVCWLICERNRIKNPSAKYLSGYLDSNEEIPNISIDTVLKSVAAIEYMINNREEPRKEIIIRTNN